MQKLQVRKKTETESLIMKNYSTNEKLNSLPNEYTLGLYSVTLHVTEFIR